MSQSQLGAQQFFAIAFESTPYTAEAVPTITLPVSNNTMQMRDKKADEKIHSGSVNANYDQYRIKEWAEGEITQKLDVKYAKYLIYLATGDVTAVQIPSTTAYRHTYKIKDSAELPTFTAFYSRGAAGVYRAKGCMINELTIEVTESDATITASILSIQEEKMTGSDETSINAAISYGEPEVKYNFGNLVAKYASDVAGLDAATDELNLKPGFKFIVKNNLDYDWSSGNTATKHLIAKRIERLGGTPEYEIQSSGETLRSAVSLDSWRTDEFRAYEFDLTSISAAPVGDSTVQPSLTFTVARAKMDATISNTGVDDYLSLDMNFPFLATSVSDGYAIKIDTITTVPDYTAL